jgi:hypothetical protein
VQNEKRKSNLPDDIEQSVRFVETAKNLEIPDSGVGFERVMKLFKPAKTQDIKKNNQSKQ